MKLNNTDTPVKQSGKRLSVKSLLVTFNKEKSYCHYAFNSFDYNLFIIYTRCLLQLQYNCDFIF